MKEFYERTLKMKFNFKNVFEIIKSKYEARLHL